MFFPPMPASIPRTTLKFGHQCNPKFLIENLMEWRYRGRTARHSRRVQGALLPPASVVPARPKVAIQPVTNLRHGLEA